MSDKIEEIRKRHEAGSGNLPIVGLAQAETDRATLLAEVDRLRRHVDALQEKVVAESCACGYDSPDAVCLAHSPQLSAALVEVDRLRAMLQDVAEELEGEEPRSHKKIAFSIRMALEANP